MLKPLHVLANVLRKNNFKIYNVRLTITENFYNRLQVSQKRLSTIEKPTITQYMYTHILNIAIQLYTQTQRNSNNPCK